MTQLPIPDDWAGADWTCQIVEWPDSIQWLAVLRGFMSMAARGRFWDPATGSIIDAQAIGLEIEERNPVSSCDDIVTQLAAIKVAIESLDVSQNLQVTIQTNIQNSIDLVATAVSSSLVDQTTLLVASAVAQSSAQASAFAWSQALAQNFVGVYIQNNTESQFRPIEPGVDPDPTAEEATPTGITDVLENPASTELCRRVYWLCSNAREFFTHLSDGRNFFADTILGIGSAAADALWVAALRDPAGSKRFLFPAAALVSLTHQLADLLLNDPANNTLEEIVQYFDEEFETLVCEMYEDADNGVSTKAIATRVFNSLNVWGHSPQQAGLVMNFFNLSSLAALYYVAPLLDTAPALPVGVPAGICTACLE